jgi:ATP-dependent helicase Lhr and Lhr-like helicase
MPLDTFHPAVATWFGRTFDAPTPAQREAWPAIASGRHTLIAAPTGSGKTLAAFLAAIDDLVRRGIEDALPDETAVVYVSPLKALSNDVRINLERPLAGIRDVLLEQGLPDVEIRTMVRTGDTPQAERDRMRRRPPHIVVTTPESLYILLGSASGRSMLSTTRSVIIDEIHALAPNKRGAHLALSLERLEALCGRPLVRIGLSATQKPIEEVARYLTGFAPGADDAAAPAHAPACAIVDAGHVRARDLALELPESPLEAVMSGETWGQVHARLERLIGEHRTTLVFVNTRRMAERLARHLSDRLGKDKVTAHHGSMSKEHRHDAEQRLKRGQLSALVATASLELGIDIGDVDLVCQIGTPRAISTFLQRVGRSGHAVGGTPKGRLFPLSRDELVECAALLDAVRRGELDTLHVEKAPLDVLAQQVVAEVASRDWREDELHALFRRAYPFAAVDRAQFATVVRMLAEGFSTRRGPRGAYLHRDAVNGVLRASRGARLTAITSGGAIPDTADYEVVLEPQATLIGSVHEDFAVESLAGDIFQLGNHSYRILRVERGRVRVEDAQGAPPSIPFWLGEAPGRSDELSHSLSRLRHEISQRLEGPDAHAWLAGEVGLGEAAARQILDYLGAAKVALGLLPTRDTLAMERFFDESGGTQLVIHSPFGSRLNRAWGLALRKRFCRSFNFELQAAATEDAIVLSLSTSHSFPLEDVARYLHSSSVHDVLVQALLDAPMFGLRWRWNATTALALPRFQGGSKVPPQLQRMKSEDLLATVFPDQVACLENIVGERQIPDHPLVAQTLHDCLHEAMDIDGLVALLQRLEGGQARIVARDLTSPSPLAAEILGARPYAFLDDAPLEERRTQAVAGRRWSGPDSADDLGRLDPDAIVAVQGEAWPEARSSEELHAALMGAAFITDTEALATPGWPEWLARLAADRRVCGLSIAGRESIWVPAERLPQFDAILPGSARTPAIAAPAEYAAIEWAPEAALVEILRARLTALGPVRASVLAASLGLPAGDVGIAMLALERDGFVMRGRYRAEALPADSEEEWCERHLLARIHRYTVKRLRREIEPVEPRDYMRFLFDWQRVAPGAQVGGPDALAAILAQLEGFEAPASAWEGSILPARIEGYEIAWLDALCQSGRVLWSRLRARKGGGERAASPVRATPIVLLQRRNLETWLQVGEAGNDATLLSSRAQAVAEHLERHGASFFDELLAGTRLLHVELEEALGELVAAGLVNADSFAGLRALLVPPSRRASTGRRHGRRRALFGIEDAGRWSLARRRALPEGKDGAATRTDPAVLEQIVQVLLRRYGVVCWRLLEHEAEWLPPWRELLRTCQRLEARGEIRGGRFIAGVSGEQFALPEAIALLRGVRQRAANGSIVCISGADPLNLVGGLLAGERVPRLAGSRVLYRDGVPIAKRVAGEIVLLGAPDPALQQLARDRLLRDQVRMPPAAAASSSSEEEE